MVKLITIRQQGYTLFELAMVLLIVSVISVGTIRLMAVYTKNQKHQTEKSELANIKSAIIQFAIQNGRLPCPDTNGDGNMGDGSNVANVNSCGVNPLGGDAASSLSDQRRVVAGLLPFNDLGVAGKNQYGKPFHYVVTLHYADIDTNNIASGRFKDPTPMPTQQASAVYQSQSRCSNPLPRPGQLRPSFSACSKGGVDIKIKTAQGAMQTVYEDIPFVVISLGKNGVNQPTATEQMNIKAGSTSLTENRTVVLKDDSAPAFDDALIWETSGVLALHLLKAGILP